MRRNMVWITLCWAGMVAIGGFLIMTAWNLVAGGLFGMTAMGYGTGLFIAFVLGILKRSRGRRTCSAAPDRRFRE